MILFSGTVARMGPLFVPAIVRFPVEACRGTTCRFDDLSPDSYVVVASAPGGRVQSGWIDLRHNTACKLDLKERVEREDRYNGTGTIRVEGTPPFSKVVLLTRKQVHQRNNQTPIPQDACIGLPCKLRPLARGSYRVVVSAPGYRADSYPVELSSDRELAIHVDLEKH